MRIVLTALAVLATAGHALAGGGPGALPTREAEAALARLADSRP